MSSEKYLRLVFLLIRKTKEKTAAWETTPRDDVFALSLPDYSVRISLDEGDDEAKDVVFQIVNSHGVLIDSFRDAEVAAGLSSSAERSAAFRQMADLYEQARRHALGVDKALDKLIAELDKP